MFEACPARWKTEFLLKSSTLGGSAADLGTAVHAALEIFVKEGKHKPKQGFNELKEIYDRVYWLTFADAERYAEGLDLLNTWWQRTEFAPNVTVASTETKEEFPLKANGVVVPFRYIWDRCDIRTNSDGTFDVEVIDYKTVGRPVQPEDLHKKVQARAYGLAAAVKYPQARHVWVTFDLLRYDQVGTRFTREENVETYRYLQNLLRRILASDGDEEQLNPECRYCVRAPVCKTLMRHTQAGGILGITDPHEAADMRAKLDYARAAIERQIDDLDEMLLKHLEQNGADSMKTDQTELSVSIRGTRHVDPHRVARVIGNDLMAEYGNMRMGDFDRLMKDDRLTSEQKSELRSLVGKNYGKETIKTRPLSALGDDE